jgi:hypothetical protein
LKSYLITISSEENKVDFYSIGEIDKLNISRFKSAKNLASPDYSSTVKPVLTATSE